MALSRSIRLALLVSSTLAAGGCAHAPVKVPSLPPVVEAAPAEVPAPSLSRGAPLPPSAIGVTALIPRETFGLPVVAWIGGALYLVILILILGSLL